MSTNAVTNIFLGLTIFFNLRPNFFPCVKPAPIDMHHIVYLFQTAISNTLPSICPVVDTAVGCFLAAKAQFSVILYVFNSLACKPEKPEACASLQY